ncbi:UNVERIFIED_CONTAM: hypothetical protein GTU68_049004 [Idotea baltica]|nr:hypothetical protein [Idotea baltica]
MESVRYAWLVVNSFNMVWEIAIRMLVIGVGIEILVFSFFLRPLLSIGLIFVGFWPFILHSLQGTTEKSLRLCWIGACILLASFTYMPVVGQHANYTVVEVGGLLAFGLIAVGLFWCGGESWALRTLPPVVYIQGGLILASVYLIHSTTFSIRMKEGLPLGNQVMAWAILASSFVLPLFGSRYVMGRLVSVTSSLLCPFLLLSIRHEVFFYIALSVAMFLWLIFEYYLSGDHIQIAALKFSLWRIPKTKKEGERDLAWADIRRAFFFLFFVILAFFGTGNMGEYQQLRPLLHLLLRHRVLPLHHGCTPHPQDSDPIPTCRLFLQSHLLPAQRSPCSRCSWYSWYCLTLWRFTSSSWCELKVPGWTSVPPSVTTSSPWQPPCF